MPEERVDVLPVAVHHGGFPIYECSFTSWNVAKTMGPKRDIMEELAEAVCKEGLHFGASTHGAENWRFFDQGKTFESDVGDPAGNGQESMPLFSR